MALPPSHLQELLPDSTVLSLESIQFDGDHVSICVCTRSSAAHCPICARTSRSVHSRYVRRLKDLPWHGAKVEVRVRARRFRCRNPDCERKIFAERIPSVTLNHGQQTRRLSETLRLIGYMLGGNPGARLSQRLGIQSSSDTILRRLKIGSETETPSVRVLGIDDWAWRRGQRYGTLLVDLEGHRVLELLPDRSALTVTRWLQAHPEVEVISRDRAGAYAEAAETGAPNAIQVADRFHLMCNFGSAVERALEQKMPLIREAMRRDCNQQQENKTEAKPNTTAQARKDECRERRLKRYNETVEMFNRGMSQAEICRATGMEKKTVRRFLQAGVFPERARPRRRAAQLDGFQPYLRQRWTEGCHNATQLWREIRSKGYPGGRGMVAQFVSKLRIKGTRSPRDSAGRRATKLVSPKAVAMLLTKPKEELDPGAHAALPLLLRHCPELAELQQLGRDFQQAFQLHSVEAFTAWMERAARSTFGAIHRFATGLRRDEAAIAAAVSLPWSNGQVEGQVHRLKLIKRQMYGRAGFQLLRRRVLPYKYDRCPANSYRAP